MPGEATSNNAEFEREKWQADIRLRERELAGRERELDIKNREVQARIDEQNRSRWTNPLVLAVMAAALAAAGNAAVAVINGILQRSIEESRAISQNSLETKKAEDDRQTEDAKGESARILEVIKTNDPDRAAINLSFLLATGLITNEQRRKSLSSYLQNRSLGQGPVLPAATTSYPGHFGYAKASVAWVELVGPGRQASIRFVVSDDASCPILSADGELLATRVRAEPGPLFREGKGSPRAEFPVRVCEALAPEGKKRVLWGDQLLPLPVAEIKRIVVFGDTGCRIKKGKKPQDCANADKWPYAKVAQHAAQAHPDLVIHVGDYLYRESCDVAACAGAKIGYGWDGWDADFFTPSAPLLAAAPWIMVRGNHENCSRAADGWFRFLANTWPQPACADVSPPFVVDLGGQGFVVMDGSAVASDELSPSLASADDDDDDEAGAASADGLVEKIRTAYGAIAPSIPPHAWLLTHSPFYGVRLDKKTQQNKIDNTIEMDAIGRALSPNIAMIVSGHIHIFEALSFARTDTQSGPQWPPQLVVGTGGDKLTKEPHEPDELFDRKVDHALIVRNFAYMMLDRDGANWKGTLFDEDGMRLAQCDLSNRDLICRKEP
jgi:predicted phosphodiesterase